MNLPNKDFCVWLGVLLFIMLFFMSGCATVEPQAPSLKLNWGFCEVVPQENWACLGEDDFKKVHRALMECQQTK